MDKDSLKNCTAQSERKKEISFIDHLECSRYFAYISYKVIENTLVYF